MKCVQAGTSFDEMRPPKDATRTYEKKVDKKKAAIAAAWRGEEPLGRGTLRCLGYRPWDTFSHIECDDGAKE
jgi:hypothetical protein